MIYIMYIAVYNTLYIIFIPKMDIMLWAWKFLFTTLGLPTADDNLDGYRISDVTSQGEDKLIQDCLSIMCIVVISKFCICTSFSSSSSSKIEEHKIAHGSRHCW